MRSHFVSLALAALAPAVMLAPSPASAQVGPLDQNRADRQSPVQQAPQQPAPQAQAPAATVESAPPGARIPFSGVVVDGATLSQAAFQQATARFQGRLLDLASLREIAAAAGEVYARSDVALYSLEVPPQDFAGGRVRLRAIEGRVAQVALRGNSKAPEMALLSRQADPLAREAPLTKPTLQRQLSLMRDTPGIDLKADFLRSAVPGALVLGVDVTRRPNETALTVTTRGAPNLGRVQLQADHTAYGLLRGGDLTRVTVALPTDIERFQYVALTHTTPLGADGLRLQGSAGYLRTRPDGADAEGEAKVGGLQLSYPLIRSYTQNLYLSASLDGLDSRNATFGQVRSSEQVVAGRVSAAWSLAGAKRNIQVYAAGSHGSTELEGALPGTADDRFRKLNLQLAYDQALGQRVVVRARGLGQFTRDRLTASELISLGGDAFGRAFAQSTVMGDEGAAASLELAVRPGRMPASLRGSELYVFGDSGRVRIHGRYGFSGVEQSLASAGLGVRLAWRDRAVVGLEGAYAADAPRSADRGEWRLGFNLKALR